MIAGFESRSKPRLSLHTHECIMHKSCAYVSPHVEASKLLHGLHGSRLKVSGKFNCNPHLSEIILPVHVGPANIELISIFSSGSLFRNWQACIILNVDIKRYDFFLMWRQRRG